MAKKAKKAAALTSLAECNEAMYLLLEATIRREEAEVKRDAEIAAIQRKWESAIACFLEEEEGLRGQLQEYYMSHLGELEKDGKKSVQLHFGVMGRRLSAPALKLLNKSWTWRAVLSALRLKFGMRYVRISDPEVNKEALKEAGFSADELKDFGLKLHQDERFYAEPARPPASEV